MKHLLLLLTLTTLAAAQGPGESIIPKKNIGPGSTYEYPLISPNQLLGRTSAGTLSGITLGTGLTLTGTTLTATAASGSYQPLHANLTNISALTTTSYGLNLLTVADDTDALDLLGLDDGGAELIIGSLDATSAITAQTLTGLLRTPTAIEFEHQDETLSLAYTRILAPDPETPAVQLELPLTNGRLLADTSPLNGANLTNNTITGSKLATGTLTNDKLANSTITLNGTPVALGGSLTLTTSPQSGHVVQIRTARESAVISGTTTLPLYTSTTVRPMADGTLALAVTITPTSTTNRILVRAQLHIGCVASSHLAATLGRSTDTNARTAAQHGSTSARTDYLNTIILILDDLAGTTSPITYHARIGGNIATTYYLNRAGAGAYPTGATSSLEALEYVP